MKGPEDEGGEQGQENLINQDSNLQREIGGLGEYGTLDVVRNMAVFSLVGLQIRGCREVVHGAGG